MRIDAIVALKTLSMTKKRLVPVLGDDAREALVSAMAIDVLSLLQADSRIHAVHVICGDGWTEAGLLPDGVSAWREVDAPERGLNGALEFVAKQSIAEAHLFMHADLPFLTQQDLSALIDASEGGHAVFAPDTAREGTNALLRWADQILPLCFGVNSFAQHCEAARVGSVRWRAVERSGLLMDLDAPSDLERLNRYTDQLGRSTAAWSKQYQPQLDLAAIHCHP